MLKHGSIVISILCSCVASFADKINGSIGKVADYPD